MRHWKLRENTKEICKTHITEDMPKEKRTKPGNSTK